MRNMKPGGHTFAHRVGAGLTLLVAAMVTIPLRAQSASRDTIGRNTTAMPNTGIPVASRRKFLIGAYISGAAVSGPDGKYRFADYPLVSVVLPGSPAALSGMLVGDRILSENGRDAREGRLFATDTLGASYRLRVKRGEELLEFTLVSVRMPPASPPPKE
jgi:hypothetical protein